MINDSRSIRPDRPFFAYLPFGATHAPHQAPASYLSKYRGRYDEGWDVHRQRWYERQLELGVIPAGTELAPRNPGVLPWEELSDNQQRLACRLQEAFAAFLDHTDDQIGRLIDGLRAAGELDNTIVIVMADNGASQEGGPDGVLHEMKYFNGLPELPDEAVARLEDIGGPNSHTNYPWGWAQCGNTPFKWYKQNTHEGGVHVPMVMHWPDGIEVSARGSMRNQFINVADVVPTIYDLLGVTPPATLNGKPQMPVTGHSFATLLSDADAPAANRLQYFEMAGSRALVAEIEGRWWKAVTRHRKGIPFDEDQWELYDLDADPSECHDLADSEPDQLKTMIELWWSEAEKHGVLPLDDRTIELFRPRLNDHSPHRPDRRYRYRPPMSPIPIAASPGPGSVAWDLAAAISFASGDEGTLYATGNANAGMSVFIQGDRLVVDYNAFGSHVLLESDQALAAGELTVSVHLRRVQGYQGTLAIGVNGQLCGQADLPLMMMMISSVGASIGEDHGLAVSDRYQAPYPYSGDLHFVDIEVGNTTEAETVARSRAEMARQ
jgi:arylsulfatase